MNLLIFSYFFIFYSFLGWLIETIYVSIKNNRYINRGLLDGPFCPIYGFGALIIIIFVFPFRHNNLLFFLASIIVTSILEYLTASFFEFFFKLKLWDYSKKPFNIHGKVCLQNSLYWGTLSILVLTFIHPNIIHFITFIVQYLGTFGIIIFIIYFIIDATDTFSALLKLKNNISQKISNSINLNPKILRLFSSFPDFKSKINNDFVIKLKSKFKKINK